MQEQDVTRQQCQCEGDDPKFTVWGTFAPPQRTVVSHEAFAREAVIQRIVLRLRDCDLATLETMAGILEQDGRHPGS